MIKMTNKAKKEILVNANIVGQVISINGRDHEITGFTNEATYGVKATDMVRGGTVSLQTNLVYGKLVA